MRYNLPRIKDSLSEILVTSYAQTPRLWGVSKLKFSLLDLGDATGKYRHLPKLGKIDQSYRFEELTDRVRHRDHIKDWGERTIISEVSYYAH